MSEGLKGTKRGERRSRSQLTKRVLAAAEQYCVAKENLILGAGMSENWLFADQYQEAAHNFIVAEEKLWVAVGDLHRGSQSQDSIQDHFQNKGRFQRLMKSDDK